jgi:hypothetical protein
MIGSKTYQAFLNKYIPDTVPFVSMTVNKEFDHQKKLQNHTDFWVKKLGSGKMMPVRIRIHNTPALYTSITSSFSRGPLSF